MYTRHNQRGVSLVELIMFIVIVGVALAGILLVMNTTTKGSADPLIHKQALAIAESLLEEIELQDFSNPPGGFDCAVSCTTPGTPTQQDRKKFDSIMDYNGFATTGVFPANGAASAVAGLDKYNVSVAVANTAWGVIPAASAAQITVTVTDPTDPGGQALAATGYRVDY